MAFLRAFGSYVPPRVVGNAELAARLGCEADWIRNVSGISERRYAGEEETVADLGIRAGQDCLAAAGNIRPDMVIVSSGTSERRFPGPAAGIAAKLGLIGVPAIDLPMASAGSLFGLAMAAQLAKASGPVLVIAAEKMSPAVTDDKSTAILFGDGAGACLVDPEQGAAEINAWELRSDGSYSEALRLEFGAPLHMDGGTVIMQAARKAPAVIRELLDRAGKPVSEIGAFLMHQANQNLIARIAKSLGVAPEKFFSNIARYGNTSSASMLIAAAEWSRAEGFRPGEPVVFATFGAGFHWGALLATGTEIR